MERLHVFVDESGDEHLNITSGASKNYVLAAVLVPHSELQEVIATADQVRRRYFQTGEMKSSGVGGNATRRMRILDALKEIKFRVIAFCVPKERLDEGTGLSYSDSFLKYTAKLLCSQLPKQMDIRVVFDGKGRSKFRAGFKKYLELAFPQEDLFRRLSFESADSKGSIPIQIADIYAGSISKLYESREFGGQSGIHSHLKDKANVWEWPRKRDWGRVLECSDNEEFDSIVRREAFARVWAFIDSNGAHDEDFGLKVAFLKLLVDHSDGGDGEFMHSDESLRRMKAELGQDLDGQALRNRVVGPLRDAGLLLASSSKGGYRIPISVHDVQRYVDLCNSQIPPSLARLSRTREIIQISTAGRLDILSGDDLRHLQAAVDSLAPLNRSSGYPA